jgi:WhiB family redox-sensing transcriptional regulator
MAQRLNSRDLSIPRFIVDNTPACSTVDPELFFPQEIEVSPNKVVSKYLNMSEAKRVCANCPLALQCLEYALKNAEIGIWGGTTESQRESLRRKHKIALNRKIPTPNLR